jgi:Mn2+/Fe2+ NRAMP family transporter
LPAGENSIPWAVALWGGIGGTVTVLCYGYWIREEGREGTEHLPGCRVDLASGYAMTALFGVAMVIIGSTVHVSEGNSTRIIAQLAEQLQQVLGSPFRWAFLIGAWTAVFSSMLGVWQSVPYLFADTWGLWQREPQPGVKVDPRSWAYRGYLWALASLPAIGLWGSFKQAQLTYAIVGACFVPLLAVILLLLNRRPELGRYRNSWWGVALLVAALVVFLWAGILEVREKL